MVRQDIEQTLRHLAARRRTVEDERGAVARETAIAVNAARRAGLSVVRIAEIADLSRQTIHRMLRE